MKTAQQPQTAAGLPVHPLALSLLLVFALLVAADWSGPTLSEHGARLTWALLLCWSLLATWRLHGWQRPSTRLPYALLVPLGLVPWTGLVALLLLPLALLLFLLGSLMTLTPRMLRSGLMLTSASTGVGLACLLTLTSAAMCADVITNEQLSATEQLAWAAESDQQDRRTARFVFNPQRDLRRRELVMSVLLRQENLPVQALTDAGLVLVHSSKEDELALALGVLASARQMGDSRAAALEKVAIDRLLLAKGLPQVHRTQWLHAP